jgi:SulP family sulfate permease
MRLGLLKEIRPWMPSRGSVRHLPDELFGAFIAAILVIPQGITFAYLAGLPPEHGIYTSIFVTLMASLFGATPMLGGPNTAVALLISTAVAPYAVRGSPLYLDYVLLLSFMVGLIQLVVWLLRGGRYFMYFSPAAVTGITSGVEMILVFSSLDGILGVSNFDSLFFFQKLYLLSGDAHGLVNPYSLATGALTVACGLIARR